MSKELTTEEYKIEVLKARIGQIVAEYEDRVANYEVAIANLRSQIPVEGQDVS